MNTIYDNNGYWLIEPEEKINKVKVFYKGSFNNIQKLKKSFSSDKSSDIFPAIDEYYDHSIFFYDISEDFINTLQNYCKEILISIDKKTPEVEKVKSKVSLFTVLWSLVILIGIGLIGYKIFLKSQQEKEQVYKFEKKIAKSITETDTVEKNNANITGSKEKEIISNSDQKNNRAVKSSEQGIEGLKSYDSLKNSRYKHSIPQRKSYGYNSRGDLKIIYLDVGQADCQIIITPRKKCYVIDAGKDAGDGRKLINVLHDNGINEIEALFMTHPHSDHIGGVSYVLNNIRIRKLWDSGKPYTSSTYRRILKTVKKKNIPYGILYEKTKFDWGSGIKVKVLHPEKNKKYKSTNNYSIVMHLTYGKTKFLFTGDAEKEVEAKILAKGYDIRADVIKVGHHGSRSSSTLDFLSKVRPKYAIIQVGKNNRYGHPKNTVIRRYKDLGVKIYRTDYNGNIEVSTNGYKIKIKTERNDYSLNHLNHLNKLNNYFIDNILFLYNNDKLYG